MLFRSVCHADTVLKNFIREDGSVRHIVEFNAVTGEYVQDFGGQGYEKGSSWTRGQTWALYGFTLSYYFTKEERYLKAATKIADYFLSQIPDSYLIPVDFCQPKDCKLEDSTASAIAASGLLFLANFVSDHFNYREVAIKLVQTLDAKRCNWSDKEDQLLEKCTAAFHDKNHEVYHGKRY